MWSIYPLITLHTLLLRLLLHFTKLHPATLYSTSLHFTTLHFLLLKLHPATLHNPLIWLNPHLNFLPLHFTSHHYTSPHFTSLHCTLDDRHTSVRFVSPLIYSFHFTPYYSFQFTEAGDVKYNVWKLYFYFIYCLWKSCANLSFYDLLCFTISNSSRSKWFGNPLNTELNPICQ